MEIFKIDLMITSQSKEFNSIMTENLEAEGLYGLFRMRMGEKSYGVFIEEIANKLHPQDDLYYWIAALLEAVICFSEAGYCAIRDIEHPGRWFEFVNREKQVEISVIDAAGSSDLIVKEPFLEKKIVVEGSEVDKDQMVKEIVDKANKFIASVMKIESRFAETNQHKRIVDLINNANGLIAS